MRASLHNRNNSHPSATRVTLNCEAKSASISRRRRIRSSSSSTPATAASICLSWCMLSVHVLGFAPPFHRGASWSYLLHRPLAPSSPSSLDRNERDYFGNEFRSSAVRSTTTGSALFSTRGERKTFRETWSGPENRPRESRFGVRRRVRQILERARLRTGITNSFSAPTESVVTAHAALVSSSAKSATELAAASVASFDDVVLPDFMFSTIMPATASSNNNMSPALSFSPSSPPMARELPVVEPPAPAVNRFQQPEPLSSSDSTPAQRSSSALPAQFMNSDDLLMMNGQDAALVPLPFTLPKLTAEQRQRLAAGERVQEQSRMGREGSGFVVMDLQAPPYLIWECLLDFEAYPERIGTVRSMRMFTNTHLQSNYHTERPVMPGTGRETRHYGTASITRASFVLSKFRFNIAAIHRYQPHPDGHYMIFSLDKACTNAVLQDAQGIWYTETNPDGRGEDWTRVWLLCNLKCSPVLPTFVVNYAAKKAMPRATTWLPGTVQALKQQLL